ncbi:hypothetical protein SNE40_017323 [Patella caerulea]|uniref:C-type lectin domain-containing protein n=1 Tax=Patella caerulea TaxID=87958 RepID=A0AAN8JA73_PATCE
MWVIVAILFVYPGVSASNFIEHQWDLTTVPTNYPLYKYDTTSTTSKTRCTYICQLDETCTGFIHQGNQCTRYNSYSMNSISPWSGSSSVYMINDKVKQCIEKGYVYYREINLCIRKSTVRKTWNAGQIECTGEGGDLMIISTPAKLNVFQQKDFHDAATRWFVGATDNVGGVWKWIDGSAIGAFVWAEGEPNNTGGNEHCMVVNKMSPSVVFYGTDKGCNSGGLNFVCELKLV